MMGVIGWVFNLVAYFLFLFVSSYVLLFGIRNTGIKKDYLVFFVIVFLVLWIW
jgi:hypothetical protein